MSTKLIIAIILIIPFLAWLIKSLYTNYQNQETINFYVINNLTNVPLIKLYNFPTNIITIILALYLFLTLIVVVKITNIFEGPLRHIN